jgi:hypothetical protein
MCNHGDKLKQCYIRKKYNKIQIKRGQICIHLPHNLAIATFVSTASTGTSYRKLLCHLAKVEAIFHLLKRNSSGLGDYCTRNWAFRRQKCNFPDDQEIEAQRPAANSEITKGIKCVEVRQSSLSQGKLHEQKT